ncbi:MAG: SET domain-containing protein [Zhongshania sp.]|uniref:SET domain-containing protein n=1 Tax=Zhongshania sp. TaxID=1971902 RepID=UPI0026135A0E|nr:SET domain-containing protein [Zhongshania sp.]MDF1693275.1 SET domain-containing protein [Zhongshania sp.]
MTKYYRVASSKIHGRGLFARRDICGGFLLGICKTKPAHTAGLHTLTLPDGRLIDVTCTLKYINHSKSANVIYYDDYSVVALRDIAAGEELLHDYGDDWD